MDPKATRNILEAALLAANTSVSFDKLVELFTARGVDVDRGELKQVLASLADDYADREIELKETASGFRIQVRSSAREWLQPLFEERAPRYTRALLETLALVAYRQPITRAEIEDVRGVAVSSNIIRTLMERGWIRVVGYRDVPGRPSMLGTTREFLDYFGLKRLDDLPPLAEVRELGRDGGPQSDFVDELEAVLRESSALATEEVAIAEDFAGGEEVAAVGRITDVDEIENENEDAIVGEVAIANENGTATADEVAEEETEPPPNVVPIKQSEA